MIEKIIEKTCNIIWQNQMILNLIDNDLRYFIIHFDFSFILMQFQKLVDLHIDALLMDQRKHLKRNHKDRVLSKICSGFFLSLIYIWIARLPNLFIKGIMMYSHWLSGNICRVLGLVQLILQPQRRYWLCNPNLVIVKLISDCWQ